MKTNNIPDYAVAKRDARHYLEGFIGGILIMSPLIVAFLIRGHI